MSALDVPLAGLGGVVESMTWTRSPLTPMFTSVSVCTITTGSSIRGWGKEKDSILNKNLWYRSFPCGKLRKLHSWPLIDRPLHMDGTRMTCGMEADWRAKLHYGRARRSRFPGVEIYHETVWIPVQGTSAPAYLHAKKCECAKCETHSFPRI